MSTRILRYYDEDEFGDNNKKACRRKVSLTFPCIFDGANVTNVYEKHRRGINAVKAVAPLNSIFTCGRDGFVRQWAVRSNENSNGSSLVCCKIFEGHSDWVSGVECVADNQTLITSSHDSTIKLWRTSVIETEYDGNVCAATFTRPIYTVSGHKDYVKKITYSPVKNIVASVGLDSQLIIWDIVEKAKPFAKFGTPEVYGKHGNSLYTVDITASGTTVVAGGLENTIYVWDIRTNKKNNNSNVKIEGHNSYVRCVKWLNDSNNFFVSGSSDNTVKAWDLRMNKCMFTSVSHEDSVFAVAISNDNKFIYSSGKDNNVLQTTMSNGESTFIGKIERGEDVNVLDLCYEDKFDDPLWIATESSDIEGWGSKPGAGPRVINKGYPAVGKHRSMQNHVEIAIADDSNPHKVRIWNVLDAAISKQLPDGLKLDEIKDKIEKKEVHTDDNTGKKKKNAFPMIRDRKKANKKEQPKKSRKWFDVKSGSGGITIMLDERQCFKCPLDSIDNDAMPRKNERISKDRYTSTGAYFLNNIFKDIVDDLNVNKVSHSNDESPRKFDDVILMVAEVVPGATVQPICFQTRLKDFFVNCNDGDLPQWFLDSLNLDSR
eukprot:g5077.t1